ncbi:MAG: hypothetical protein LBN39_10805, partial [Planctomycetaceae bacterium]|nr:hypothetical protein [Planctomycetaceae bacterium]
PKKDAARQYEIVELSVNARQGDSGGPILNEAGELAGVLFGSDMVHNTAGSCCKRVNLFLSQTQPKLTMLPDRPEMYFATIEPSGPLRQLNETKHVLLPAPERGKPDGIAGSASSFGVRSNPQRYIQPATPASVTVF